jgi:hypothetical protein
LNRIAQYLPNSNLCLLRCSIVLRVALP